MVIRIAMTLAKQKQMAVWSAPRAAGARHVADRLSRPPPAVRFPMAREKGDPRSMPTLRRPAEQRDNADLGGRPATWSLSGCWCRPPPHRLPAHGCWWSAACCGECCFPCWYSTAVLWHW